MHRCSGEMIYVEPKSVGQFTGLKDKNGTEIYEGDILEYWGGENEVVFKWGQFKIKHTDSEHFDIPVDADITVTGNIYEQ